MAITLFVKTCLRGPYEANTSALIFVISSLKEYMAITNTVNAIRSATGKHLAQKGTLTTNQFDDAKK